MENQEINNIQKDFDLGTVLSITTSRLFTNMYDVYQVLNYLTGDNIYLHQIPRVMDAAKPYVLSLHPELKGVGEDVIITSDEDATAFVNEQKKVFGEKLPLKPMSKFDGYSYMDPIDEAVEIKFGRNR